ncbi:MAG: tRNA modification GTPase [Bacteroidetes bacterium]|nr:MAG: tRNA modification GTPase [Bacteroidota bacterium]
MRKLFLTFLYVIISIFTQAQNTFEKGYYLNDGGQKTEGLIKIQDWRKNPADFQFKASDEAQPVRMTIDSITEFGVTGMSRYIRKKVKIDRSGELIGELSIYREPVFNEEVLFLRMVVEGKHRLYEYITTNNLKRYFIESDNSAIEQLICKSYLFDNKNVGKNNDFRKQLWLHLRCDDVSMTQVEKAEYEINSLTRLFEKFNQCEHAEFTRYERKARYDNFNLTFRPGLNISTFEIKNPVIEDQVVNIGAKAGFQIGCEVEFILPFRKNKWALLVEPGYMLFEAKGSSRWTTADVKYHSVELPVGIRYYLLNGKTSRIFINGSVVLSHSVNSEIFYYYQRFLLIHDKVNGSVGLGYKYKNRFSMEFRTGNQRRFEIGSAEYKSISFLLGYSIL